MLNQIILLSKDVLRADYLSPYGNRYWKTPHIAELAEKGTLFCKHYTAAPSSAMAYTCMFSGLNAYELERSKYTEVRPFQQAPTLFDIFEEKGHACHVIWDTRWYQNAYRFSKSYGSNSTKFHNMKIEQTVGPHKIDKKKIDPQDGILCINNVLKEVDTITDQKIFLWIHLPHVLAGRAGYGTDIDLFDYLVGEIRKRFDDKSIYITADHGHMNCEKGVPVYGAHVYEPAIRIPLITPKIDHCSRVTFPTSNIQLKDIILHNQLEQQEFIYSDTQYYAQPNRKLAIIKDNYKYIFNKKNSTEELYDINWDPSENVNLLQKTILDKDRGKTYFLNEVYFYPYVDEAQKAYQILFDRRNAIWREGTLWEESLNKIKGTIRYMQTTLQALT